LQKRFTKTTDAYSVREWLPSSACVKDAFMIEAEKAFVASNFRHIPKAI
jgi:hypothetical protein